MHFSTACVLIIWKLLKFVTVHEITREFSCAVDSLVSCPDHTPAREKGLVTIARFLGCAESAVLFSRKPIRL